MKFLSLFFLIVMIDLSAQPGQQFDPKQMAGREKQWVVDSIKGLNIDQLALLDVVYENFAESLKSAFESMPQGDREAMMKQMTAVREEKNALMKDILSLEQYEKFIQIQSSRRRNWGGQRPEN